ncbi:hypothetical protein HK098_003460 [Nowakowskiella sp. JEL0407]|nr:hypothetical protein HK098_003460 [Nowakowskiella sp. JEL0407]
MARNLSKIVVPAKSTHTSTIIMMHGLGDSGEGWKPIARMLSPAFPGTKWILPNAPSRSITINGGMHMPGWYDIFSLSDREGPVDDDGILESISSIDNLVKTEIESGIKAENIIIGGFSQGGALTLLTAITSETKFGGFFALSGYIPPLKNLSTEKSRKTNISTPVFMSHGTMDQVVQFRWSKLSHEAMKDTFKFENVEYNTYSMGHDANEDTLRDLTTFLRKVIPK